jgi:hypothetical protein
MYKEDMQRLQVEILDLVRERARIEREVPRSSLIYKRITLQIHRKQEDFNDTKQLALRGTLAELRRVWGKRLNWTDKDFLDNEQ